MSDITIGTCSICRGPVRVPQYWMGIITPIAKCSRCGAEAADHGPVIPMHPRNGNTAEHVINTNTTAWPPVPGGKQHR